MALLFELLIIVVVLMVMEVQDLKVNTCVHILKLSVTVISSFVCLTPFFVWQFVVVL